MPRPYDEERDESEEDDHEEDEDSTEDPEEDETDSAEETCTVHDSGSLAPKSHPAASQMLASYSSLAIASGDNSRVLQAVLKETMAVPDDSDNDEVNLNHHAAPAAVPRGASASVEVESMELFGGGAAARFETSVGGSGYGAKSVTGLFRKASSAVFGSAASSRKSSKATTHPTATPSSHAAKDKKPDRRASQSAVFHMDSLEAGGHSSVYSSPSLSPRSLPRRSATASRRASAVRDITNTRRLSLTASQRKLSAAKEPKLGTEVDYHTPTSQATTAATASPRRARPASFSNRESVAETSPAASPRSIRSGGSSRLLAIGRWGSGTTGPAPETPCDVRADSLGEEVAEEDPQSVLDSLSAALHAQRDGSETWQGSVETLRLIVHALQVRGKAGLATTIRREALKKGIQIAVPQNVKLAGRGTPYPALETELYTRYQASLQYLPTYDPTWDAHDPWPTQNHRRDVIVLTPLCLTTDDSTKRWVRLTDLIDHLFLDRENAGQYPFKVPIQHNFTQVFFTMYPEFIGPDVLFSCIARFYLSIPDALCFTSREDQIRQRVLKVLGCWVRYCLSDFSEALLVKARGFAEVVIRRTRERGMTSIEETGLWLLRIVQDSLSKGVPRVPPRVVRKVEDEPESKTQGLYQTKALSSIKGLCDEEVARQLCLVAYEDFAKISTREFLNCAWSRGCDLWPMSVNLRAFNERQSVLCDWVATEIIAGPTPEARREQLRQFVRVGYHCLKQNNLAGAQAIHTGVYNRAVRRMKKTVGVPSYSALPRGAGDDGMPSEAVQYEQLDELCDQFDQNCRRRLTDNAVHNNLPCIPIMSNVQRHITVAQEMGPSSMTQPCGPRAETYVNWQKITGMALVLMPIVALQSRPYAFQPIPKLMKILNELPGRQTAGTLDKESAQKEPDERYQHPPPAVSFASIPSGTGWGRKR